MTTYFDAQADYYYGLIIWKQKFQFHEKKLFFSFSLLFLIVEELISLEKVCCCCCDFLFFVFCQIFVLGRFFVTFFFFKNGMILLQVFRMIWWCSSMPGRYPGMPRRCPGVPRHMWMAQKIYLSSVHFTTNSWK